MSNTKKGAAKTAATDQKETAKATTAKATSKATSGTVIESFRDKDDFNKVYPIGEVVEAEPERISYLASLGLIEVVAAEDSATSTDTGTGDTGTGDTDTGDSGTGDSGDSQGDSDPK